MVADSQNNYDDIVDKFLEQKKQQTYLTEDENDMKIFKFHLFVFFSLLFLAMCITFVANAQQPHNLIFNLKFCFFCFLGLLFIIAIIATPIMFLIYIFNLLKSSFSEFRHDMNNVKQRKCKIEPDLFKFIKKTVVFIVAFLGMMYLFFIEIGRFIVSLIHKKRYKHLIQEVMENIDVKTCFYGILADYKEKYNNYVFGNIVVPTVLEHFEKNKDFYIQDEHFITNEKEINKTELEKWVVQLLLKTIDIKLTSGDYHIYFGVLDDRGQELLKLYKLVIKEFIRLGILDENTQKPIDNEWCERNIKSLIDDIKTIG